MNREHFNIVSISFQEIALNQAGHGAEIVGQIEQLADSVQYQAPENVRNALFDKVDYAEFLMAPFVQETNFGHVFMLYNKRQQAVGFMISLCNHEFIQSRLRHQGFSFPFGHCSRWFQHDMAYLKDLDTLGTFAFCFQLAVLEEYQNSSICGTMLLDEFERFYCQEQDTTGTRPKSSTMLLAASINESQFQIIRLLKKRNQQPFIDRHQDRMPRLDFTALFLDHYYDANQTRGHWFRVVQIPDNRAFSKQINYQNIRRAFSTIIPIQLNQAVNQINRVIGHMGAKMTWSSFFHDNPVLEEKYALTREHHGFFLSLLDAEEEKYFDLLDEASEIMDYLHHKQKEQAQVASLTKAFDKGTAEIFFFNGKVSEMQSFVNPVILDLADEEVAYEKLVAFAQERGVIKNGLHQEEATAWHNAFLQDLQEGTPETRKQKEKYIKLLSIEEDEIRILNEGIINRYKDQFPGASINNNSEYAVYKAVVKRINKDRPSISVLKAWRKYIALHRKLYDIDSATWEDKKENSWCHAIIPINFSPISKTLGVMFSFYCKCENGAQDRMDAVAHLISAALPRYLLNNLIKIQERDAIELATRYGIAAVTTRNMAHHVGSHILAHTSNPATIRQFRTNLFLTDFDEQIGRFHEYLRTKTHLLADMISSNPVSSVSRWLNKEIISHFNQQDILTRYVSGSHIKSVRLEYRDRFNNGQTDNEDVLVQVPNGDLGMHAFFMIITNMVRNVAKYEPVENVSQLIITARVVPREVERKAYEIDDNNPQLNAIYSTAQNVERGYEILLYDNVPRGKRALNRLVTDLNSDLEEYNAKLGKNIRGSGWGLLEMSAAAAYLRKKSVEGVSTIHEPRKNYFPLITAEPFIIDIAHVSDEDGRVHKIPQRVLAYRIYLKKPREALVVQYDEKNRVHKPVWGLAAGIRFISVNELNTKQRPDSFTHHFAICFSLQTRRLVETSKRFPLRWLKLTEPGQFEKLSSLFAEEKDKFFNRWVWETWVEGYASRKQLNLAQLRLSWHGFEPLTTVSGSSYELVFDLHGSKAKADPTLPQRAHFYQTYGSVCATGRILSNANTDDPTALAVLKQKLMEAAITEVIIVDERIQRQSEQVVSSGCSHLERLRQMNIHLPDPEKGEPDLYLLSGTVDLENWLAEKLSSMHVDFIVLHLGLLESLLSSDIKKIEKWIKRNVEKLSTRSEIVLVSGRGRHIEFPDHYLYQPVSTISEFILTNQPSKLHLTQVLFSSRTRLTI